MKQPANIKKRAQASVEYLIVVCFVTFAVISTILLAYFYSGMAKDRIILNQVDVFANKIINSAESVYYAGEPTQAYITTYLPAQVKEIQIIEKDIVITTSTNSGTVKQVFSSKVALQGSITASEGIKKIKLHATQDKVLIN